MSKAASSPTARLLQTSRLFSLPRPLPPPPLQDLTSTGAYRGSDTTTTPYPTHQAITTPRSSLSRGDFGLKRALPAKTTRNTSTPHVKVKAQDTYEHVTEFASAADHTQSREKWLEMGIPIVRRKQRREQAAAEGPMAESVFDDHLDNTDPQALTRANINPHQGLRWNERASQGMKPKERWKFKSPWVAGMQEGEFRKWLMRKIFTQRHEWHDFLRQQEMQAQLVKAQRRAREEGSPLEAEQIAELKTSLIPSDEELGRIQKALRDEHIVNGLSSRLTQLLTEFLDLPPTGAMSMNPAHSPSLRGLVDNFMADTGPPTTHPSAGLSHLRTHAVMDNHPLYGPQKHRSPIEARVVRPRFQSSGTNEHTARLGVGGFVAADPISSTFTQSNAHTMPEPDRMAAQLDPDIEGGNKMWVHPETATIDEKGLVNMSVSRADPEALAVKEGKVDHIHEAKRAGLSGPRVAPASPSMASRPNVQGFDDLVGRDAKSGSIGEEDMAGWMKKALERENGPRA